MIKNFVGMLLPIYFIQTADPYKLTFVLKGMDDRSIPYARERYMNLREKAVQTTRRSLKMSDNHDLLNDKDVCSFEEHEAGNVCSNKDAVAYRDGCQIIPQKRYTED